MIEEKRKKKIDYKIQLAVVNDLEEIHQIIIDRCNWFLKNNIKQWNINHYPKKYNLEYFKEQMKINKLYVAKTKNRVIGVMLLKETDKEYWLDNKNAFYIHHLATSIDYTGVGNALLTFAINQAKRRKKDYVRLDCVQSNSKLNQYYRNFGFVNIGSIESNGCYHNLWEMKIENKNNFNERF